MTASNISRAFSTFILTDKESKDILLYKLNREVDNGKMNLEKAIMQFIQMGGL
ncbi:hypothetical protein JY742_15055 [Clostridioides difficile]|nr:hypothetical protein [Clostridioides difficile]